jgi:hypothetical protein
VNSVNPNPLTLRTTGLTGATGTANYTVSVDKADPAYVDSDRAVSGTITVTNPLNSGDIVISSINDVVSQGSTNTPVTPTGCSPALPATLGPGDSLTCSYSTPLTSSDAGKNTATAVVSDSNTTPLANGVGSANFAFGDPTKEVDKNVGDVSSGPKTFTYNRTIGPYDTCGDQSVKNTATLYGDNDAVLGEASATVTAHVLCNAKVVKTVSSAAPSGSQSFTFELRQGATTMADGTILESKDANAGNGGVINFATGLEPGSTYQICEWVLPGWNTNLTGDGPLFVPGSMTTPSLPNPNVNNMTVCANFTVGAGPTRTFNVDNTPPPGGRALTIGFWKNWASCASSAGKGQKPMLDLALGKASSATTNPPYGLVVSAQNPGAALWPNYASVWYLVLKGNTSSTAPDCAKAVNLLNKTTIDGKKMASDPLFNMTAQLVAAQLNRFMGAGISGVTIINIDRAVLLNGKYKFDGKTYSPKLTTADTNLANCLATQLDNYNNDRPANSCP